MNLILTMKMEKLNPKLYNLEHKPKYAFTINGLHGINEIKHILTYHLVLYFFRYTH